MALRPDDPDAAAAYLAQRLRSAGGEPELLLPGAVQGLHQLGGGWPGRMNTLADNALYEAYLAGRTQVTRGEVERAGAALGWSELPEAASTSGSMPTARPAPARGVAESTNPDLDAELEAAFEPAPQRPAPRRPVPERAAAGSTVIFQKDRGPRPPPKLEDAVDELFTELIEE